MPYADRASSSASLRTNADAAGSGFVDGFKALARELRLSVPDLSDADKHLLKDVADDRYPMVTLVRMMAIASRSLRPEHREGLAELVRAECLAPHAGAACVSSAFDLETEATGLADLAQRHFERAPCPSTWQRVRDALTRQMHATRRSLDAVHSFHL